MGARGERPAVLVLNFLLLVCASESRKGRGRRAREGVVESVQGDENAGVLNPCSIPGQRSCCGDGVCAGDETEINCMADCPGVTTERMCGEETHSDRAGQGRTFGVSFRAKSAQDCCDKCRSWTRQGGCNSWTFCGYPVCFGLDTGWNHTFGEYVLPHSLASAMHAAASLPRLFASFVCPRIKHMTCCFNT